MVAERHDEPHVAQLKGERRMANAIANAVAARERVPANLPTVYFNGIPVTMRAADVTEAIAAARRTRQPHNKARETFVNEMLERMRSQYIEQLDYTPEAAEVSDFMSQLRLSDPIRIALNLAWLPMDAKWMLDQMLSKPAQLKRYAPWLTEAQVRMLTRERGAAFTRSDIPLLDEAMELLGPDPR
ncbi:ATP-dependent DNA helicase, partial [Limosilactobacillus reuteri]